MKRRQRTVVTIQEGDAREEFDEVSDEDEIEDPDAERRKRLEMCQKPDSILEIYAEAYGYEKLGITNPNYISKLPEQRADWWTVTSDGMIPLSLY